MGMISDHVKSYRGGLAVSYGAAFVENTFELLYPTAIGLAVDGLLRDSMNGIYVFVALSLSHTGLGLARQWHDTRLFNRMYASLATDLVEIQRTEGVATSSVAARTVLVSEYVEFLGSGVSAAIAAGFALIGSLIMLFQFDPMLSLVAAAAAVPVAIINRRLMRKSTRIFRVLNDRSEREVLVIERGSTTDVRRHFRVIGGHWNRLSDAEATSWGIVDVIGLGLSVFALMRVTDSAADVGTIFAVIAYVWAYLGGFDQAPAVLQQISNLGDIRRRLEGLDETEEGGFSPDAR